MVSFEDQIAFLKSVGIELKPGVTIGDLLDADYDVDNQSDPYFSLLSVMGESDEFSTDIWYFDTECIEGRGSYVDIARRMAALSDGLLPLENIEDEVDYDSEKASLSFVFHGQPYKWELEVESDWVDGTVFSRLVQLHNQQNPSKRFIYAGFGQDGLIACATPQQLESLNRQTGLEFIWLT